jgi:predicted dehydrogenase
MMNSIQWGLIGCGDISRRRVAPALAGVAHSRLVAVSRARAELAAEFAQQFGADRWYADWRELIDDPELNAVYVSTPVSLHAEQTIAAAEKGKHVLCEKPMAMSVGECDRMIAACRANGVRLGVAYYRRNYPVVDRVKAIIASGEIGTPVIAQINAFERFNPTPENPRYWLVTKAQSGGGPMMDFGCHRIEVLLNLLGPIRRTVADVASVKFEREVEDTAVALFEFASGARGVLSVTHAAFESQDTLELFGTEGSIHIPVLNRGEAQIKTAAGERIESHPPHENFHWPLIEKYVQALLNDQEPAVDGEVGREVARIEAAIYGSI